MFSMHPSLDPIYFTGRRVRLTPIGTAKLLVPVMALHGLVLRCVALPGQLPMILVEFMVPGGRHVLGTYAPEDLEVVSVSDTQLREDLLGRRVYFPQRFGIDITFPPDTKARGVIKGVRWEDGEVKLIVWVEQGDTRKGVFFVTPTDFTQCDLVFADTRDDTG